MQKEQNNIRNIVFLLIGITILIGIIWKIGAANVYQEFLKADISFLTIAFFLLLSVIFIKAYRWNKLFLIDKQSDAWKIYLIGMAVNQTMPTGTGELARVLIAKNKFNIPTQRTLAPVIIERLADSTFIIALSIAYFTFISIGNGYLVQMIIPIMTLIFGYSLLLRPAFMEKCAFVLIKFCGTNKNILYRFGTKISQFIKTFNEAISIYTNDKKIIWQTIILTLLAWFIYGIGMFALLIAFGYKVPILIILAINAASEVIGTFSFLPGGLGVKDGSFAALLLPFDVPIIIGISVFLMARAMGYVQLGVGSFISLASLTKNYPELEKNDSNKVQVDLMKE